MPTNGLSVDKSSGRVWVDGQLRPKRLSKREVKFILHLAACHGQISSRQESVEAIYETKYEPADDQRLDALVGRIRKKIGDSAHPPRFLFTSHARGHYLKEYIEP